MHQSRGVDATPVCFALASGLLVTPVELVKPKTTTRLQRIRNLEHDPRATLLCEHWDREDWSNLWWVRASLRRLDSAASQRDSLLFGEIELKQKYTQYRASPFDEILLFEVINVVGWSARPQS